MTTPIPVDRVLPRRQREQDAPTSPLNRPGYLLAALLTASCGFPRPADVGPDDAGGEDGAQANGDCQLTAIEPSVANTDDVITLEGTFVEPVTVNFPGETSVAGTMLGPHRVQAIVPALATEGKLTVTACDATFGSLRFHHASFALGLGKFESGLPQTDSAQQTARLTTARQNHASAMVGSYLYLLGGMGNSAPLSSVERARLNADGSLGAFETAHGVQLVTARQAHTTAVIGRYLYIIGGLSNNNALNSIERSLIAPDGSLGPFETAADIALTIARHSHTSAVIGTHLYILGGLGTSSLNSVERAVINVDGSLGTFETVANVTLATARHGHTAIVIRNYIYILGGTRSNGDLQDVERATIDGDGALGRFSPISSAALMTERSGHTSEVIGNYLYIVGGVRANSSLNSVERAPLATDGSLGSFTVVSEIALTTARHHHTTAKVGNYLHVLGGTGSGLLNSIERAPINISGSLGPFANVPDVASVTEHIPFTTALLGSYLYLIGGTSNLQNSIERAAINADKSLGSLTTLPGATLTIARSGHAAAVVGNSLYLVGGFANAIPVSSAEQAIINTDGSLGSFMTLPVTLTAPRFGHTAAMVINSLYVIGGVSSSLVGLNSVERAIIDSDGSLGSFTILQGVTLTTTRCGHTTIMIGRYLYVIGGSICASVSDNSLVTSIERALINPDGSLGSFAIVPGVTLATGRRDPAIVLIGAYLYVLGGSGSSPLNSIERAAVNSDDTLGNFSSMSGVSLVNGRYGHRAVAMGNYLYVVGGFAPGQSRTVERAALED